jgi:predicted MFS family arabinose efflux permease
MDEIELATRSAIPTVPTTSKPDAKNDSQDTASIITIATSSPQYQHPKGIRLVLLTVGLMLSILLAALDISIIATAIPAITTEFGSIANIAWYGTAYSITNGSFKLVWGKAYQYFPLKRVFMLSVAIFELGNIICGASKTSEMLILGRVVSGIGGGGLMTGSFIVIAISVQDEYRAAYMGVVSATFGISSVAGPLLGGGLTDSIGWRWCFWYVTFMLSSQCIAHLVSKSAHVVDFSQDQSSHRRSSRNHHDPDIPLSNRNSGHNST